MKSRKTVSDGLMNSREVATFLNIHENTVYSWVRDGELPALRLGGTTKHKLRFLRKDIDEWIQTKRVQVQRRKS